MIDLLLPFAMLAAQVGPDPSVDAFPGLPDELQNRPAQVQIRGYDLATCLRLTTTAPQRALDMAQGWRENSTTDLDAAQSAHCLGLAMVKLGRMNEARRAFELASAEAPQDNLTYAARLAAMAGNAALADGDAEAALPLLDRAGGMALAAEDGPLAADLRVDLARVLVRAGRLQDASDALDEAREADPLDAESWLLSATLSRRMERLGGAQTQIERAAQLAPTDPKVGLEAGVIAAMAGREADAKASFNSVVDLAPGSPEAARAEGYLQQLTTPIEE